QDERTHRLVVLRVENRPAQLVDRLRVQGVEDFRTVDREDRDRAVALDEQVLEGHNESDYRGNGSISQPSTSADAMNPANIMPPNFSCSRASSFVMTAKTSETKNANKASNTMWLDITTPLLLPSERHVERVDHDQQVHQAGDDDKRVAVLV